MKRYRIVVGARGYSVVDDVTARIVVTGGPDSDGAALADLVDAANVATDAEASALARSERSPAEVAFATDAAQRLWDAATGKGST